MQVERQHVKVASGKRVSNTYITYLWQGESLGKLGIIPHEIVGWHQLAMKGVIRLKMDVRLIR